MSDPLDTPYVACATTPQGEAVPVWPDDYAACPACDASFAFTRPLAGGKCYACGFAPPDAAIPSAEPPWATYLIPSEPDPLALTDDDHRRLHDKHLGTAVQSGDSGDTFRFVADPSVPPDELRFMQNGKEVGRIVGLASSAPREALERANAVAACLRAMVDGCAWSGMQDATPQLREAYEASELLLGAYYAAARAAIEREEREKKA